MSKRSNKKIDLVEERRRELRISLERVFELAAEWLWKSFGRRIKRGAILDAIGKYKRRRHIVDWMRQWLSTRPMAHA